MQIFQEAKNMNVQPNTVVSKYKHTQQLNLNMMDDAHSYRKQERLINVAGFVIHQIQRIITSLLQDRTLISMDVGQISNYTKLQINTLNLRRNNNNGTIILRSHTFKTTRGRWPPTFSLSR